MKFDKLYKNLSGKLKKKEVKVSQMDKKDLDNWGDEMEKEAEKAMKSGEIEKEEDDEEYDFYKYW